MSHCNLVKIHTQAWKTISYISNKAQTVCDVMTNILLYFRQLLTAYIYFTFKKYHDKTVIVSPMKSLTGH